MALTCALPSAAVLAPTLGLERKARADELAPQVIAQRMLAARLAAQLAAASCDFLVVRPAALPVAQMHALLAAAVVLAAKLTGRLPATLAGRLAVQPDAQLNLQSAAPLAGAGEIMVAQERRARKYRSARHWLQKSASHCPPGRRQHLRDPLAESISEQLHSKILIFPTAANICYHRTSCAAG